MPKNSPIPALIINQELNRVENGMYPENTMHGMLSLFGFNSESPDHKTLIIRMLGDVNSISELAFLSQVITKNQERIEALFNDDSIKQFRPDQIEALTPKQLLATSITTIIAAQLNREGDICKITMNLGLRALIKNPFLFDHVTESEKIKEQIWATE